MVNVRVEKHYGVDVFVSVEAEEARKNGCLCIHEENGETMMCEHLRKNFEFEGKLRKNFISVIGNEAEERVALKRAIKEKAAVEFINLIQGDGPIANDGVCRLALVNYASCLSGNLAIAVTRCPHYKKEDK